MGQTTFGFGDTTGHNNWAFAGSGTNLYHEWESSSFGTGQFGRIVALAARWSGYTSGVGAGACTNPAGNSVAWASSGNHGPDIVSNGYNAGTVSSGGAIAQLNNAATADYWQNNNGFWLGLSTGSTSCFYFTGTTNNGSYTGGTGGPGGGSANWGGTGAFGFGTYGTVQVTLVFVRRAGAWTPCRVFVRRAGAWVTTYVYVRRAGAWTGPLNMADWLQQSERHIPEGGLSVEVWADEEIGWEPGWIVETDEYAWFGTIDPTYIKEWWKPGQYSGDAVFTGRYSSAEPEEWGIMRLEAMYHYDKALRDENYKEADKWLKKMNPGNLPIVTKKTYPSVDIPESDPEPILLGCNCGG